MYFHSLHTRKFFLLYAPWKEINAKWLGIWLIHQEMLITLYAGQDLFLYWMFSHSLDTWKVLLQCATLKERNLLVKIHLNHQKLNRDHLAMWLSRCHWRANLFPQVSHLKGLSPVCILKEKFITVHYVFLMVSRCWLPHMPDKICFCTKCFLTVFTLERFFCWNHPKKK